jgi:hypothetical protein
MAYNIIPGTNPRISGRRGEVVSLNVDFYKNGMLADPYAIRYVEIYKTNVTASNRVAVIPINCLGDGYPLPLERATQPVTTGDCGTEGSPEVIAGSFILPFSVPADFAVPDVYYDVWHYFATEPVLDSGTGGTDLTGCDYDDAAFADQMLRCCHRFWIYPEDWYCSDKLQTIRFGFEPIDQRFYTPERRPLEVGIMPLPLYDYNFNLVNPMIPYLTATIRIETQRGELLVCDGMCTIGLRQGSYRSNPYVVQYDLDTTQFLRGTYQYQIKLALPDGSSRVSKKFVFTVS